MADRHLLILGGTGEARDARRRGSPRGPASASPCRSPAAPAPRRRCPARLRIGGFGGADGPRRATSTPSGVDVLVDATHPFARRISANAARAAAATGVPLVILARPPWQPVPGDRWTASPTSPRAAARPRRRRRAGSSSPSAGRSSPPSAPRRSTTTSCAASSRPTRRPPRPAPTSSPAARSTEADGARACSPTHASRSLVAKNSGGAATYGKIAAARALGLPVVIVDRAGRPGAAATVEEALDAHRSSRRPRGRARGIDQRRQRRRARPAASPPSRRSRRSPCRPCSAPAPRQRHAPRPPRPARPTARPKITGVAAGSTSPQHLERPAELPGPRPADRVVERDHEARRRRRRAAAPRPAPRA